MFGTAKYQRHLVPYKPPELRKSQRIAPFRVMGNLLLCVGAEEPLAKVWAKIVVIEQDHPQSNFYVDLK